LGGQSKRYCNGSEKTLWDVSDNNTNGENQVDNIVITVNDTEDEENKTEGESDG
jgi:hypothetical protein